MKGYGQFCPVAKAAEIVGERWTPLILRELISGSRRFNEIQRGVPLMSPSLLSQRLKSLESAGVVERRRDHGRAAQYVLTPAGAELQPLIEMLGVWGQRWVHSKLGGDELDAGLLMWDIRRRIDVERLPPRRLLIQFDFRDGPKAQRMWWLLADAEEIDLCLKHPGFDVDLFVATDRRTLTRIWLGQLSWSSQLRAGTIELHGPKVLREGFPRWLLLGTLAHVGAAQA